MIGVWQRSRLFPLCVYLSLQDYTATTPNYTSHLTAPPPLIAYLHTVYIDAVAESFNRHVEPSLRIPHRGTHDLAIPNLRDDKV